MKGYDSICERRSLWNSRAHTQAWEAWGTSTRELGPEETPLHRQQLRESRLRRNCIRVRKKSRSSRQPNWLTVRPRNRDLANWECLGGKLESCRKRKDWVEFKESLRIRALEPCPIKIRYEKPKAVQVDHPETSYYIITRLYNSTFIQTHLHKIQLTIYFRASFIVFR